MRIAVISRDYKDLITELKDIRENLKLLYRCVTTEKQKDLIIIMIMSIDMAIKKAEK